VVLNKAMKESSWSGVWLSTRNPLPLRLRIVWI